MFLSSSASLKYEFQSLNENIQSPVNCETGTKFSAIFFVEFMQ